MNGTSEQTGNEALQAAATAAKEASEKRIANQRRRGDFEKPRPGTFATLGDAYAHAPETSHVSWVSSPVEDALAQLGKVAANERLTVQARAEDWQGIKNATQAQLDERYDDELAEIETKLADLEVKSTRSFTSEHDPAKLNYLRETLNAQARAGQLPEHELLRRWRAALDQSDLALVQVMTDNAEAMVRSSRPRNQRDYPLSAQFADLMQASDDALRTPDQKRARAEVLKWEATRWHVRRAYTAASTQLRNARMQGKEVIDGAREDMRNQLRRSF